MSNQAALSEAFLNSDVINDDFFLEIVEKKMNTTRDKFKLRLVLLSPAAEKNENYSSTLFRAKIKIEIIETKSYHSFDIIIKVLLSTSEEIKKFSVFLRERLVYDKVLRNFEKIWLEKSGECILFGPQSFKFETDPYEIIVLEDLKADNYVMMNRKTGLDLAQSKILLAKLAKFHATSVICYEKVCLINW